MQTILVTGADGFIGSHLTEMLLEEGHHVRALFYYNSFNDWRWLEGLNHPELEVVTGNMVCGGCIFAGWPMWRSAPSSILPGSIWGSCCGPCLVLARPKAGPMLESG